MCHLSHTIHTNPPLRIINWGECAILLREVSGVNVRILWHNISKNLAKQMAHHSSSKHKPVRIWFSLNPGSHFLPTFVFVCLFHPPPWLLEHLHWEKPFQETVRTMRNNYHQSTVCLYAHTLCVVRWIHMLSLYRAYVGRLVWILYFLCSLFSHIRFMKRLRMWPKQNHFLAQLSWNATLLF